MFGVLHMLFDDGYEAVLDLRSLMDKVTWCGWIKLLS